MAFPEPGLDDPIERPEVNPGNQQDVVPTSERNKDQSREAFEHELTTESERPLTDDEKKAADRDTPIAERVYAPASERVPGQPVPGHRDVIEHPDTHTPEREAASHMTEPSNSSEAAFTGSARPNNGPSPTVGGSTSDPYPPTSNPNYTVAGEGIEWQGDSRRKTMFMGLGVSWVAVAAGGVGLWLFLRWRNERNKPINRFRRQAMWAASELRERVPTTPDEAARPAIGLTSALLSIGLLLWQQSRARSEETNQVLSRKAQRMGRKAGKMSRNTSGKASKRAADAMSELDWQARLSQLKERWNPSRLELEKIQISKK